MIWKNFDVLLRYAYIVDRPANEANTFTASGYTIFNLGMAYNWKQFTVYKIVENILNMIGMKPGLTLKVAFHGKQNPYLRFILHLEIQRIFSLVLVGDFNNY
jgi:hypothetical protein